MNSYTSEKMSKELLVENLIKNTERKGWVTTSRLHIYNCNVYNDDMIHHK